MIVVPIQLWSAKSGKIETRGLMIIDNIDTQPLKKRNYRCRMYRAGTTVQDVGLGAKPIREGEVRDHPAEAEPIQNLVLKALLALNYKA